MLRHVTGAGGVSIACEESGKGPPLVLVHGAGSARWSFDLLRPHLERGFSVIAVDRRGRGDSTDGSGDYLLDHEYEDVAAVVRDAGPDAVLMGHSYGGLVAAGAAGLTSPAGLVLYEAPMGGVLAPEQTIERWERLVTTGATDRAVREFLNEIGGYSHEEIEQLAATPMWEARLRVAPTLARELRAERAHRLDRAALGHVAAPTLLLLGTESPAWAVRSTKVYAEALPGAQVRSLEGHGHGGNVTGPELLATELRRFAK